MSVRAIIAFMALSVTAAAFAQTYTVVTEEYPPYEYSVNGKPAGLDIEILTMAASKAGINLDYQFVPWARAEFMVKKGEAEAIIGIFRTAEREQFLYYPVTNLSYEKNVIFAAPGFKDNPAKLADLAGMVIGTNVGYSYGATFDNFKDCIKDENPDTDTLLRKLVAGRTQLAVTNLAVGLYTLDKMGAKGIRVLPINFEIEPLYIGFSKAAPRGKELYNKLQIALADLEKSGQLDAIRKKFLKQ